MNTKRSGAAITAAILAAFAVVLLLVALVAGSRWPVLFEIGVLLAVILLVVALIIWLVGRSRAKQPAIPSSEVARTNGFAIVSLVLSLVGLSVLAIIFGHVAKSQVRRTGETGSGLATAGLILGYLELLVSVGGVVYALASAR